MSQRYENKNVNKNDKLSALKKKRKQTESSLRKEYFDFHKKIFLLCQNKVHNFFYFIITEIN